jgi:hypothetical protein
MPRLITPMMASLHRGLPDEWVRSQWNRIER